MNIQIPCSPVSWQTHEIEKTCSNVCVYGPEFVSVNTEFAVINISPSFEIILKIHLLG